MDLYSLHLFSGAGGGILADKLLGIRTVGAVEIDEYARRVLMFRQLDGSLDRFPVWDDVRSFRCDNPAVRPYIDRLRQVRDRLVIAGGFPCQDISCANKRAVGITGARSGLWKEFARIVGEIRPRIAFVENSSMLVKRGLETVLQDFAALGYTVAWSVISAQSVGAPHLRRRFWAVAVNGEISDPVRWRNRRNGSVEENAVAAKPDAGRKAEHGSRFRRNNESGICRVSHGVDYWVDRNRRGTLWTGEEEIPKLKENVANRRDRLAVVQNGQVPLCAAKAFEILLQICNMTKTNNNPVEPVDGIDKRPRDAIERICFQLKELLLKKNADYGSAAFRTPYLNPNGTAEEAILTRLSDKYERLHNVLAKDAQVAEPAEETIIDIAGYCVLFLANRELNRPETAKEGATK